MTDMFRIDQGKLGEARIDHNGNLVVKAHVTRTGVFTYRHSDGRVTKELRHPDDVYHPDALASFIQVPVTDDHPSSGRVTPENFKLHAVGNLGDSMWQEGNLVATDMYIRDAKTIAKIQDADSPKRFVSCGYKADVIKESGVYNGERYDHRQTNIRGNHVALVRNPRAGPSARLLLDSEDVAVISDEDTVWLEYKTIDEVLEDVRADSDYTDEQKDAISEKIKKIAHEHPEWENDQVVAVAHKMLGISKKKDDDDAPNGDPNSRVIGQTRSGKDVHASHRHNGDDWSVDDHKEAAWKVRDEHERLRDTLSTAQRVGLGKDAEGKIKSEMKTLKRTHDHHKKGAMTLDSSLTEDDEGWLNTSQTHNGGSIVKIKKDAVIIGSGDDKLVLDSLEIEVDDESEGALEALLSHRDEIIEYAKRMVDERDEAIGQAQGWRAKADEATSDPEKLDAMTREREEILSVAETLGFKKDEMRPLRNDEIKRKCVQKRLGDSYKIDDADEPNEHVIDGVWLTIKTDVKSEAAKIKTNKNKLDALGDVTSSNRRDGKDAKPTGEDVTDDDLSYRERAERNLEGVHLHTDDELREKGFN